MGQFLLLPFSTRFGDLKWDSGRPAEMIGVARGVCF